MRLIIDEVIDNELVDYLKQQEGIVSVDYSVKDFFTTINVEINDETEPELIIKYIELYIKPSNSILFEFDKDIKGNYKELKYTVDDMCCEYCYKGLVTLLFEDKNIKSAKSNFDYKKYAFNIEFTIEYNDNYSEEDVIKIINDYLV